MAKLNELLKDLPIIGEYLRGEEEEEEKREPILPEVHEPEARKLLNVKPADRHRHQLKHRFSLQEHLISPDWSQERPPRTDAEREAKLFAKFSYAKPDSHQNSPLVERRKSDDQLRRDEEKKEDYLKHIKIQIDKNAEEELPSVTQTRDDEVISLIPLKMRVKSTNEEEQRNDESKQKEEPQHFSTMDTERDSIVERELRFEKEKGLLSPLSEDEKDQTSTTNPDIRAESEDLKQQRPSYDDYEKEKQSYSSRADADDADLAAEQARYSEERPASPEQRIAELQTPGYDRGKPPTTVVPRNEESEPDDDSAFIEASEEKLSDSELAEKLNAPEKPAKQRAVEAMADSGGRLADINEEEDIIRPRFKCSSCQKKESDLLNREKLIGDETIDLEEIISYMNKHKSILEELIDQEDQKRLQIALNVARDLKLLGKEAVETLKKDLAHYFKIGNDKWKRACEEMEKLGPLVKDIESHSSEHQSSKK